MNPEQKARQRQIIRLRGLAESLEAGHGTGEENSPRSLVTELRQAANEIEDLVAGAKEELLERLIFDLSVAGRVFLSRELGRDAREEVKFVMDKPGVAFITFDSGDVVVALAVELTEKHV